MNNAGIVRLLLAHLRVGHRANRSHADNDQPDQKSAEENAQERPLASSRGASKTIRSDKSVLSVVRAKSGFMRKYALRSSSWSRSTPSS